MYYGTGNPSTWNPAQRPGDNKWSMSVWARDVDTGKVKWVYQMTPYDEWDFDGINEMILADINVKGRPKKVLVHFDRNGFGYTLDRVNGALLVAREVRPGGELGDARRHEDRPPAGRVEVQHGAERSGRQHQGHLPGGAGLEGSAACGLQSEDQAVLRADQPRVHGLRAVRGRVRGRSALRRRHACRCIPPPGGKNMGNFIAWDAATGKIVWSKPEKFSVWSGALTTAGDVVFYGTLEGYLKAVDLNGKELWKFKTPSGIIGNVFTYQYKGKQYVGVFSGIGGWAGIGMAAGLEKDQDGLGAVGGYKELREYTDLGGQLTVFALPN